jgi:hypothetical protein
MEPRVGIAHIEVRAADGTFTIGRETFTTHGCATR